METSKKYRLSQSKFPAAMRRNLAWFAVVGFPCFILLLLGTQEIDTLPRVIAIITILSVLGFGAYRGYKTQSAVWESIVIEVGEDFIARSQIRIPEVRITKDEVISIVEIRQGLCIKTNHKNRSLCIPMELSDEDYAEIMAHLSSWTHLEENQSANHISTISSVLFILGFGYIFLAANPVPVTLIALVLLVYLIYHLVTLRKQEGVDPKYRRVWTRGYIFMIIFILGKILLISRLGSFPFE